MMNDELMNGERMGKEPNSKRKFDLEERTARFGGNIVCLANKISISPITRPLINQLVRASTSVGANYCEANDALTKKEFFHKICICRKESKETKHWLRMIWTICPRLKEEATIYHQEAHELNLIFSSIVNKYRKRGE
jgi:four helix bundle protein